MDLTYGIGLSLISRKPPEELIFARMSDIHINYLRTYNKESVVITVKDVQVDNQLFEAQCDVLLYVMPSTRNTDPEEVCRPALQMSCERVINNLNVSSRAEIIKVSCMLGCIRCRRAVSRWSLSHKFMCLSR